MLEIIETARAKRAKFRDERINMAHGAGGKATSRLVEGLLQPAFGMELDDAAMVGDYAMTTDAFVVKPVAFKEFVGAVKNLGLFWAVLNEPPPDRLQSPSPV